MRLLIFLFALLQFCDAGATWTVSGTYVGFGCSVALVQQDARLGTSCTPSPNCSVVTNPSIPILISGQTFCQTTSAPQLELPARVEVYTDATCTSATLVAVTAAAQNACGPDSFTGGVGWATLSCNGTQLVYKHFNDPFCSTSVNGTQTFPSACIPLGLGTFGKLFCSASSYFVSWSVIIVCLVLSFFA